MSNKTLPIPCCVKFMRPGDGAFYLQEAVSIARMARAYVSGDADAVALVNEMLAGSGNPSGCLKVVMDAVKDDPDSWEFRQRDKRARETDELHARFAEARKAAA